MQNAGLDEAQSEIKMAEENINYLRYADDTTLMAESEEEFKSLLMKVKVESEKFGIRDSMNVSLSELRKFGDGQGGLACCHAWSLKEWDTTE